jgi:hypothetical protein
LPAPPRLRARLSRSGRSLPAQRDIADLEATGMALRPGTTARRIGAGLALVTVASQADDHKACHPGSHHMLIRVTFDRAAGRLPGTQMDGHGHPRYRQAHRDLSPDDVDATSNLELFYIAMPGRPGDAGRMAGQAWLRDIQRH